MSWNLSLPFVQDTHGNIRIPKGDEETLITDRITLAVFSFNLKYKIPLTERTFLSFNVGFNKAKLYQTFKETINERSGHNLGAEVRYRILRVPIDKGYYWDINLGIEFQYICLNLERQDVPSLDGDAMFLLGNLTTVLAY